MHTAKRWKYPSLVIGSAVIYGVCPTLMKTTYAYGGNGLLSTFYTCLFALPFLYLWARLSRASLRIDAQTLRKLCILGLGTCPTSLLLYSSYAFIPVGMSTTLHFIYPVATAVYLSCFFKERLGLLRLGALALAVGGIAALSAGSLAPGSLIGILLAAGSGLTWAFYMVYMEKSGAKDLPACVLNFYMALLNAVCAGAACLVTGSFAVYSAAPVWLLVVFTAVLQRVAGNAMFQVGLRGTSSFSAGIFSTFEPITSVLLGVLLLSERFTGAQLVGLVLILGGIALNLYAGTGAVKGARAASHGEPLS